jgi:hypothetical protein
VGTPQTGEYWLGAGDAERARLLTQGCAHRAQAELLFDRIVIVPRWHALDMGCGPLGVLDILADRVGPSAPEGHGWAVVGPMRGHRGEEDLD